MRLYKFRWLIAIIPLLISIAGCGGGGGNSNPTDVTLKNCSAIGQNEFVYDVMKDIYLYYDQIPEVDPNSYDSPQALLQDITIESDRFSFIADQQTRQEFYEEGTYNGIGFQFENNDNNDAYIVKVVFDDSSAGRSGLQRGDRILAIEGVSIAQINSDGGLASFLNDYEDGEAIVFLISSAQAEPIDIEVSKGLVKINSVLETDVITTSSNANSSANDTKIGYLAFNSFIDPSKAELATAFKTLKQQNITELVLDLRYNGGGRIDVAQILASYIAGDKALGADTSKIIYNDKNTDLNRSFPFQSLTDSVDLYRLYVLTLEGTCSASEIIINAMQPVGIDVVTIGQTTCGKPLGSRNIDFCDKTLSATTFDVVNDANQGDYLNGIDATCGAEDDINSLLGDPNEAMLATALYHIQNDQCLIAGKSVQQKSKTSKTKQFNTVDIMRLVF